MTIHMFPVYTAHAAEVQEFKNAVATLFARLTMKETPDRHAQVRCASLIQGADRLLAQFATAGEAKVIHLEQHDFTLLKKIVEHQKKNAGTKEPADAETKAG